MDSKRISFGIGMALLAVLAVMTAPAMAQTTIFFTNVSGDTSPGGISYVEIWANITEDCQYAGFDTGVDFDQISGNITACNRIPGSPWPTGQYGWCADCYNEFGMIYCMIFTGVPNPPCAVGLYPIVNMTIEGISPGVMDLQFRHGYAYHNCYSSCDPPGIWVDGTYRCTGPAEPFEKELASGWNLISLPLTPLNSSTSAVLGNDTIVYDAVYRYDATSKEFEDVTTGTMDPGTGYFVNVTTAGTWSYDGRPFDEMSIDLKQGLNMVGWTNTSASITEDNALDSISGNYNYAAQWNVTSPGYGVYDANAPPGVPEFIDFKTMERGNGYWIAAKDNCTLIVS